MKFTIIPDSFKNCLPAIEVGKYIEAGIKEVFPESINRIIPMADGGEGTIQAIISATGGKIVNLRVHDPLMRPIDSFFYILPDAKTAIIEMAAASGIELILATERNPMKTTTFGTGELIKAALNKGCTTIIIGVGGSATNDGGVGMAMALGALFLDSNGIAIPLGGKGLNSIARIDLQDIDPRLKDVDIKVACDVKNKLCGTEGASAVYGPQKGATPDMVKILDQGLENLTNCIYKSLNSNVLNLEGGGAAGGLGAGLVAFTQAKLLPGFYLIADIVNLEQEIKESDFVISAEGAIDFQTQFGKTPAGVAAMAKKYNKPVFVFTGNASEDASQIDSTLIDAIIPITRRPISLDEAIELAPIWLNQSAKELARVIKSTIQIQ